MKLRFLAAAGVVCMSAACAYAQHLKTVALTNANVPGDSYNETSIAVSRFNPNHLIVTCNFQRPPYFGTFRRVFFGISTTGLVGATTFSQRGELTVPMGYVPDPMQWEWWDPMTAASQSSDQLFAGSAFRPHPVGNSRPAGFVIFRNPAGTGTLSVTDPGEVPNIGWEEDKGMLAVGPRRGDLGVERMYVTDFRGDHPGPAGLLLQMLTWRGSMAGSWPGAAWETPSRTDPEGGPEVDDRVGSGPMGLVFPSASSTNAGKLFVAYEVPTAGAPFNKVAVEACVNSSPQVNNESGWESAIRLDRESAGLDFIHPIEAFSALSGPMFFGNHPCVCRHPNEPNTVFVVFVGSAAPWVDGADQNTDVYVARINYDLPTDPTVFVQRITDQMLGDIAQSTEFVNGADQFQPAITVDGFGMMHLAYLRMPHLPEADYLVPPVDVTYARLSAFGSSGVTVLSVTRLTPPFTTFPITGPRIGDYIAMDSNGCAVYVAYPKVESGTDNVCNVYVTRISLCDADIDDSGLVNLSDVGAFAMEFSQSTHKSDLNSDGAHNALDVERFLNAYTCGCPQQP